MAALNQRAVTTSVIKEATTNFVDINKAIAIISDVTTIGTAKKLYTSLDDVLLDWLVSDPFYLMAKQYFDEGGTQLYAVPLADTLGNADITGKLTDLENDPDANFSFVMVVMDKVIGVADEVTDGTLVAYAFDKEYHLIIETSEADVLTATTPNTPDTNKTYYDGLTGTDALKIGNMSFVYTSVAADYIASGIAGKLMSQDIGAATVKFQKPANSAAETLTNTQLTNILNVNTNVYTGTNERTGRSFVKEGTTLKDDDYIDTSLGAIWVKVQLEEAIYDLMQLKKIPINNDGFTELENATSPVFELAVTQGIIDGNAAVPYTISFEADPSVTRGVLGTYTYVGSTAAHFITNTVTIKTEG